MSSNKHIVCRNTYAKELQGIWRFNQSFSRKTTYLKRDRNREKGNLNILLILNKKKKSFEFSRQTTKAGNEKKIIEA